MTEKVLQKQIVSYLKYQYPKVLFQVDMAGVWLPKGLAVQHSTLRSNRGYPDLFIIEPKMGYNGLYIELKINTPYKKNNELKADKHLWEQNKMLQMLRDRGFKAEFGVGYDNTVKIINEYLITKQDNTTSLINNIKRDCAILFGVSITNINSRKRNGEIINARHLAMYIMYNKIYTENATKLENLIGATFAMDRISVRHNVKTVSGWLEFDKNYKAKTKITIQKYLK